MYLSVLIGLNPLQYLLKTSHSNVSLCRCFFLILFFIFEFDVQIHQILLIFNLSIWLVYNKVYILTVKQKGTLHLLTLGLHVMTQNKFVTRMLFIFHKSLMIPAILAELPMYMEMIQKQPMFVSHMYIVVMHLTAVFSYMYQHDILIGFSELNWECLNTLIVLMDNSLFSFNNYNVLIILWHVKFKQSIAVIKLQMAYTGVSIKSSGKSYSQGFWQRYRENSNYVECWEQKVSLIWATDFSPTLFCFSIQTFLKLLLDCFSCSFLEKKDINTICHLTSTQHNPPMWNMMRSWPVPRVM